MIIGTSKKKSKAFVQKSSTIKDKSVKVVAPNKKGKKSKGIGCPNCEK